MGGYFNLSSVVRYAIKLGFKQFDKISSYFQI